MKAACLSVLLALLIPGSPAGDAAPAPSMIATPAYDGLVDAQVTVRVQDTCDGVDPSRLALRFGMELAKRGQGIYRWEKVRPGIRTAIVVATVYCIPVDAEHYVYSHQVTVARIVGTPARGVILAIVHHQQVLSLVSRLRLSYVAGADIQSMAEVVAARLAAVRKLNKRV